MSRRCFFKNSALDFLGFLTAGSLTSRLLAKEESFQELRFHLVTKLRRDVDSYTQGLVYEFDSESLSPILYESGGRYGHSLLRRVDATNCETLRQIRIPNEYFAEGLAIVNDRLFMLTWREHACLVYDKETLKQVDEFRYRGEGWGLAFDGNRLAMSDGSSKIRFINPDGFRQERTIDVHFMTKDGAKKSVAFLNELEFVNGELWANVFQQKYVVRINPKSGLILGSALNFANLVPTSLRNSSDYVLNGLAFDHSGQRLYLTGKCWPVVYVLAVVSDEKKFATFPIFSH